MGISISFGKKRKFRKLIGNYVRDRVKEKRVFNEQLKRLDVQLKDGKIEEQIYERLRVVLEANYYQEQKEEWTKIKNKFYNPLKS